MCWCGCCHNSSLFTLHLTQFRYLSKSESGPLRTAQFFEVKAFAQFLAAHTGFIAITNHIHNLGDIILNRQAEVKIIT